VSDFSTVHRTVQAIWRIESAKVIATLARWVKDVGLADNLAQEALLRPWNHGPMTGLPTMRLADHHRQAQSH
jgi:predicted RNA polymerase sigma factor